MTFCSKCGAELSEGASFCSKCGASTNKSVVNIALPVGEWKDTLARINEELNKAYAVASKEIENAFTKAREEIRKATSQETESCPNCGEKNIADSRYCNKCGAKIKN